jgi:hypothetical protein
MNTGEKGANTMAENQITESIFEAVDVIVQKAIEQIAYDKTIVCTIVKKSEDKENCYIVSDGSINFEAFSEDEYEKNE